MNLPPKPFATPTIKLPILPTGGPTSGPAIVLAKKGNPNLVLNSSVRPNNFVSAALVFLLQAVLLFEACTSIDRTVAVLFLIVAVALSIPGYVWAFNGKLRRTPLKLQT